MKKLLFALLATLGLNACAALDPITNIYIRADRGVTVGTLALATNVVGTLRMSNDVLQVYTTNGWVRAGVLTHTGLTDLDFASSGHTGFMAATSTNHANLGNLDFASSGHTGFIGTEPAANLYLRLDRGVTVGTEAAATNVQGTLRMSNDVLQVYTVAGGWIGIGNSGTNAIHATLTGLDYASSGHTGFAPAATTNHANLGNLGYASSGHTGFLPATVTNALAVTALDVAGSVSFNSLSNNIGFHAGLEASGAYMFNIGFVAGSKAHGDYMCNIGDSAGDLAVGEDMHNFGASAGLCAKSNYMHNVGYHAGELASGDYMHNFGDAAGTAAEGRFMHNVGCYAGSGAAGVLMHNYGYYAGYQSSGGYQHNFGEWAGINASGAHAHNYGRYAGSSAAAAATNAHSYGQFAGRNATGENQLYIGMHAGDPGAGWLASNDQVHVDGNTGNMEIGSPGTVNQMRGVWICSTQYFYYASNTNCAGIWMDADKKYTFKIKAGVYSCITNAIP